MTAVLQLVSVGSQPMGVPWVKLENVPPNTKGKKRPKKEAEGSRLVDGRFNKQGNIQDLFWVVEGQLNLGISVPAF